MKQEYNWMIIAVIAVFALGLFTQKSWDIFSSYPSDCSFITNVDPYTLRYTSYANSGNWIAIDYNNDGVKEAFGYSSSSSSSARQDGCGGNTNSRILVSNFNSYGDDIYYYYYSAQQAHRIYVCDDSGKNAKYFKLDSLHTIQNVVTTCEGGGTTITTTTVPQGTTTTTIPGTTITTTTVPQGTTTTTIPGTTSCLISDTNGNGKVDRDELGTAISRWVEGS